MAGNIKGIKIEIEGNTQPLQNALKDVSKEAKSSTQELKQIDKALKFDASNVTLLGQISRDFAETNFNDKRTT